jgi:hypothetical protein
MNKNNRLQTISMILVLFVALVIVARGTTIIQDTGITTQSIISTSVNATTIYVTTIDALNGDGTKVLKLVVENGTSFPASPVDRQVFFRSDLGFLYVQNNSMWVQLGTTLYSDLTGTPDLTVYLNKDGATTLTGDWNIGGSYGVYGATWLNATQINALGFYLNGQQLGFVQPASFIIDQNATSGYYRAWYGANSTLAFQSTNASAVINDALSSGDYTTLLRSGTYILDSSLIMDANDVLIGEGYYNTILKLAPTANVTGIIITSAAGPHPTGVSGFLKISGMKIDGNRYNGAVCTYGIDFIAYYSHIEDVWVTSCSGIGIYEAGISSVHTGGDNVISFNRISNCSTGFYSENYSSDIPFIGNDVFYNDLDGIYWNAGNLKATENNVFANGRYGFYIHGIWGTISNNWIGGNNFTEIYVQATSTFRAGQFSISDNSIYAHNRVTKNNTGMVTLDGYSASYPVTGVRIVGNDFYDAGGESSYALKFTDNVVNTTVSANTFHGNYGRGAFYEGSGCSALEFEGNAGFVTEASGSEASCINGTWIALPPCFAGTPTSITLTLSGSNYINSTCYLLQPTVIAMNSTHFQIGFLTQNSEINRLQGAPVSVTTWNVAPASLSKAVDGDWSTSTTEGNKTTSSATTIGTISFDMGATYSVSLLCKVGLWSNTSSVVGYWYYSNDNVTYTGLTGNSFVLKTTTTKAVVFSPSQFCISRYVRLLFNSGAANIGHVIIYEVQALDTDNLLSAVGAANTQTINWQAEYVP